MFKLIASSCVPSRVHTGTLNVAVRQFGITSVLSCRNWRKANGYPLFWTMRGVLTDGPDYTYDNGKSSPYTNGQRMRLLRNKGNSEKILHLLKAVDYSKRTYAEKLQKVEDVKQSILSKKLKPKGKLFKMNKM